MPRHYLLVAVSKDGQLFTSQRHGGPQTTTEIREDVEALLKRPPCRDLGRVLVIDGQGRVATTLTDRRVWDQASMGLWQQWYAEDRGEG